MIFMKNYALIAVASACFLITSCTNDDLENSKENIKTFETIEYQNLRENDSTNIETDPVKTIGKDN